MRLNLKLMIDNSTHCSKNRFTSSKFSRVAKSSVVLMFSLRDFRRDFSLPFLAVISGS